VKAFELSAEHVEWTIGFDLEEQARSEGFCHIAGVDEVGRGCLAGPVVAAACILDPKRPVPAGLNDSKKLSKSRRKEIASELRRSALAYAVAEIHAEEIDNINILEATKKAMLLALNSLQPSADYILVDALRLKGLDIPQRSIIKGDSISYSIAAASVIAKTHRDALMAGYDKQYPQYGFANHKGYGSAEHLAALRQFGPCPIHRLSFKGVLTAETGSERYPF
jgi:ribonuclease HII